MEETTETKIQRVFNQLIENYNEQDRIRKDMIAYAKQFKPRQAQLKKESQELEQILLKYLDDNKLPGIRSGDFLLLADEKAIPGNKKLKEERLASIFENHQIHPSSAIYKEVVEVINNPKSVQKTEKKIKCQKYKTQK